jgi:hypothetical protein
MFYSLLYQAIKTIHYDLIPSILYLYHQLCILHITNKSSYKSSLSFIVIEVKSLELKITTRIYNTCNLCGLNINTVLFRRVSYMAVFRRKKPRAEIKPFYNQDDYHLYCFIAHIGHMPDFILA